MVRTIPSSQVTFGCRQVMPGHTIAGILAKLLPQGDRGGSAVTHAVALGTLEFQANCEANPMIS